MDIRRAAQLLGGKVSGRDQVLCPGPRHKSEDRSLSVRFDPKAPDGFVVNSFAGDDPIVCRDYVRARLGLGSFEPKKSNGHGSSQSKGRIVATYDYQDETGAPLYQVVRYEPKRFTQRKPDGKGGWIWNLDGVKRVLYRLPELLQFPDASVFFCEGEKDADRVASLKQCATTVMGGSWKGVDTKTLAGRDVVILEDADEAGRKRAVAAAATLHGTAKTIRIVQLPGLTGEPNNKDVSDWLDADAGNADKLVDVCFAAPLWVPDTTTETKAEDKPRGWRDYVFTAGALRTMKFKVIEYVVPGIIPEGLTILAGKPKVGKSWLALDLALAVSGDRFLLGDIKPAQGAVLYCALEDNQRRLWKRTRKIMDTAHVAWPENLTLTTQWRRLDQGGTDDIKDWAASVSNPRLIILDTLAGIRPERSNRDQLYDSDYNALRELHDWANEIGIAVLVLHHTRKMEADDPIDTISGTLGLAGCADTSAVLSRSSKGTTLYIRGRDVEEQEHAVLFNAETCRWTILGDAAEVQRSDSRGRVLDALSDAKELMTPSDIVAATGLGRQNVDQLLHRMHSDGEIIKRKRGLYAHASRTDLISGGGP